MFIMPARKKQGSKTYTYYNLVNTVRTPKGPHHRVVLSSGSLPGLSGEQINLLGRPVTQKLGGTLRLLPEPSTELEAQAERIAALVAEKRAREGKEGEQIEILSRVDGPEKRTHPLDFLMLPALTPRL